MMNLEAPLVWPLQFVLLYGRLIGGGCLLMKVSWHCIDLLLVQSDAPANLLEGSWDLETRVIILVTILITTYNPN